MSKELYPNETLSKKFVTKGFWLYLFTFFIAPTGYFIRVLISNDVTVEEVGILYSILSLVNLLTVYNDLGFTESLQYFLPRYFLNKEYNKSKTILILSVVIQFLTGLLIAGGLYFYAESIANGYFHSSAAIDILQQFGIYILAINLYQVITSILFAVQDTLRFKLTEFVKMMSVTLFTLGFFFFWEASILMYAQAWIWGLGISIIVGYILLKTKYQDLILQGHFVADKTVLRSFVGYSLWTFISLNARRLLGQIDLQMIVYYLGARDAGFYTNYLSLSNAIIILLSPLLMFLFPVTAELINKNETHKLQLLLNTSYKYITVLTLLASGLLLILGPVVSAVLFGTKYIFSGILLQYASVFIFAQALFQLNFKILSGLGKVRAKTIIVVCVVLFNVISNLILIPLLGIYGPLLSSILCWIAMYVASYILIHRLYPIAWDWKFIRKNLSIGGLLLLALHYFQQSLFTVENHMRYINLGVLAAVGFIYFGVFALANRSEFRLFLKQLKHLKSA